ncbi:hypothetical protein X759_31205 [Mesorhizobium sp. LSHC420B00]|nr:hypothetical protein X759_31205 [Mesorhizobium sp. LSHC420B00]
MPRHVPAHIGDHIDEEDLLSAVQQMLGRSAIKGAKLVDPGGMLIGLPRAISSPVRQD